MTEAGRFQKVRELFDATAESPADQRLANLRRLTADESVVQEVLAMCVANDSDSTTQFSKPLNSILQSAAAPALKAGDTLGVWQISREIGHGGMGSVYLVERVDGHFTQTAALKFVKGLPRAETLNYFSRERQLLAKLSHPNIARLLDGGATPSGQPYLVMEYVDGVAIDVYCRERRLSAEQVLKLFVEACDSVAFAHRQLIVHCDLKPSNLLINQDGRPMLLDFGIARLLDRVGAQADDAAIGSSVAYTPRYASPEQREHGVVSTVSDIFSLGIMLAELLGGAETTNAELKAMLAKASAIDPAKRYATVDAFAEDIQRYLRKLPVAAMPPTAAYTAQKFMQRRWPLVLAGAAFAATVLGFTAKVIAEAERATTAEKTALRERDRAQLAEGQAVTERDATQVARNDALQERDRAAQERDRATAAESAAATERNSARRAEALAIKERDRATQAERQAREDQAKAKLAETAARQTSDFLVSVFDSASPGLDSGDPPASKLIAAAEERVETKLSEQPETQALLYNMLGEVQSNMGNVNQSRKNYLRAIELERNQNRPLALAHLLTCFAALDINSFGGKLGPALANEALALAEKHAPAESEAVAAALNMVGIALMSQSKEKEATPVLQRGLMIREKLDANGEGALESTISAGQNALNLFQYEKAETFYRRALSMRGKISGEGHPLWWTINEQLSTALRGQRQYKEAESILQKSLIAREKLHGRNSNKTLRSYLRLAGLLKEMGRPQEALALEKSALEIAEKTAGRQSVAFVIAYNNVAYTLESIGGTTEALKIMREVVSLSRTAWSATHASPARLEKNLGRLLGEVGLLDEARHHLHASLAASGRVHGATSRETGVVALELAIVEALAGNFLAAKNHLGQYQSMLPLTGIDLRVNAARVRALLLQGEGKVDEALLAYIESEKLTGEMLSTNDHRYWLSMLPRAELLAARSAGSDRQQSRLLANQILAAVSSVMVADAPVLSRLRALQAP